MVSISQNILLYMLHAQKDTLDKGMIYVLLKMETMQDFIRLFRMVHDLMLINFFIVGIFHLIFLDFS